MEALLSFLIKASVSLILFYVCYKTFLSGETFFHFNRYVIIFGILACLGISTFDFNIVQSVANPHVYMQDIDNATATPSKEQFPWGAFISTIYLTGMVVNLILLVKSLFSLLHILRNQEKIKLDGFNLILIDKDIAPFSWQNYVIMSQKDYQNSPEEIITHEREHIRRKHSADIIFIEIISLFFWFNPVIWLLKKEMRDVHEYQADMGVLKSGIDASKYQLLLIKKAVGSSSYTLANSFNHSKIKKRITMMLKRKSNKWAKVKLVCLIPAALVPAIIFAQPKANHLLAEVTKTTKISDLFDYNKTDSEPIKELRGFISDEQENEPPTTQDSIPPAKTVKFNQRIGKSTGNDTPPPPPVKETKKKFSVPKIVEDEQGSDTPPPPPIVKEAKKKYPAPNIVEDKQGKEEAKQKTEITVKDIPDISDPKNIKEEPVKLKGTITITDVKEEKSTQPQVVVQAPAKIEVANVKKGEEKETISITVVGVEKATKATTEPKTVVVDIVDVVDLK